MKVKYYKEKDGAIINSNNFEVLTGYKLGEIVELTGAQVTFPYETGKAITVIKGIYPILEITIQCNCYTITGKIDFASKIIENVSFQVHPHFQRNGIASNILYAQVLSARKMGFDKITLHAAGTPNFKQYNGYTTWASLGFSPSALSIKEYEDTLSKMGYPETIDIQNLISDKKGKNAWKENGFAFHGEFILDEYSKNSVHLKEYMIRDHPNQI